jgi:hypothetical protein
MKPELRNKSLLTPLLRWLTGDATRHDERALDASAQSDPFLADAIEGYRALSEADHAADLTRLKANLRQRTQQRHGAGFYLMRVAAAVAVLVVAWLVVQQFGAGDKAAVAEVSETATAPASEAVTDVADSSVAATADAVQADEIAANEQVQRKRPARENAPPPPNKSITHNYSYDSGVATEQARDDAPPPVTANASVVPTVAESIPAPAAATEAVAAKKDTDVRADESEDLAKEKTQIEAKEKIESATKKSNVAAVPPRKITGRVTDGNGSPLAGVTVKASGTNLSTTTNADGSYIFEVPAGANVLEFSYPGYQVLKKNLGKKSELDVELKEN